MIITLDEMKNYLRVDHEDDDILLESLIASSQQLCMDVARISDEESFEKMQVQGFCQSRMRLQRCFAQSFRIDLNIGLKR